MEREYSCRTFYPEILGSITNELTMKYNYTFTYHVSRTCRMKEYNSHIVTIRRIIPAKRNPEVLQKSIQLYFYTNKVEFYMDTHSFTIPMKEYNIAILNRIYCDYFL